MTLLALTIHHMLWNSVSQEISLFRRDELSTCMLETVENFKQICYSELPIQHDTDIALLFNVSDSQAKFVVYARQTLLPTPTTYSYRRIITAEHIHYRSLNSKNKRSISTDDTKQFFEETLVINEY